MCADGIQQRPHGLPDWAWFDLSSKIADPAAHAKQFVKNIRP
jgi:hypothetical protein